MEDKYRLLDANLNRVREGLRVVEDVFRFLYNDKRMWQKVRGLRHSLTKITEKVYPRLVEARSPRRDVGEKIKEGRRRGIKGIVLANIRRAQEGVRVLEEFSRLISPDAGEELKRIRFELYSVEKDLVGRMR